ncbi:hypothetical protein [Rhizobium deserti]|nr:hypothetical protein [Rhizobium deserti]
MTNERLRMTFPGEGYMGEEGASQKGKDVTFFHFHLDDQFVLSLVRINLA